ncbi:hypothetical protein [Parahaliea aestuarii]|uniref:Uncharacterized protein n=1 Tax=Parahaliea aestuarii TaxID=1852021 RepID=A0A5C8ZPQ3_9GAMM|nr:hypothetical protein [Parahaliea aestuarii]TXS90493.1 hypothetical protein FVW59_14230 [Parahaliea aestuarii]
MAEQTKAAAPKTKAAPKRKAATAKAPAKRKAAAKRKSPAAKSTVRSNVRKVENKAAAYERDVRKAARKAEKELEKEYDAAEKSVKKYARLAQENSRKAFLASLGFYGKAYDQAQEQFGSLQERMETRRAKASEVYADLVKRGEKVEADARDAIDDIEIPAIGDRKALEAKLAKARARFEELKGSISEKFAA